mgnify:CR=1 FL=1
MKYLVLLLFICCLGNSILNEQYSHQKKKKQFFKIDKPNDKISVRNYAVYKKSLTGDKSALSPQVEKAFLNYGLYHLLTPSGLHISSIFLLSLMPCTIQIFILVCFLITIIPMGSYLSLERVILFKILANSFKFMKIRITPEIIFLLTLCLSVCFKNYAQSPLSFMFSCLFWGTILIYRGQKIRLIIFLNISQHIISLIMNQPVNILSIIINPIYTFSFITIFPLFIFNTLTGAPELLSSLINLLLNWWLNSLIFIHKMDTLGSFAFTAYSLLILSGLIHFKLRRTLIFFLCLLPIQTFETSNSISIRNEAIIKIGEPSEKLRKKNNVGSKVHVYYIDQRCTFQIFSFLCKKKPSNYGGPII